MNFRVCKGKAWKVNSGTGSREGVPQLVENFEDLLQEAFSIMIALGPYICHDVGLMYRLVRIAWVHFEQVT